MAERKSGIKAFFEDMINIRVRKAEPKIAELPIAKPGDSLGDILVDLETSNLLDVSQFNQFRMIASDRESQYRIYDEMCLDSIISSAIELYADDATQYNSKGQVIWAESEDTDISAFANRLIDVLDLNKNAWSHIYSLVKYGDLFLETFRDEETMEDDPLYTRDLRYSDTVVGFHKAGSKMEEYVEMVRNPAEMFDLVKYGKTVGFIKVEMLDAEYDALEPRYAYQHIQQGQETMVLPPDKYVHVMLSTGAERFPETLNLSFAKDGSGTPTTFTYNINRGKSILHDLYKIYKEVSLMEDSLILNRVTRSSIIRMLQVEVGDMPKAQSRELLKRLKQLIEQKNYMDKNSGYYTSLASPGPIDNVLYIPTHNGKGQVTMSNLGGDVDVKSIADLDYFQNKLYGGLKIPKQFLGNCLRYDTELILLNGQKRSIGFLYEHRDEYIGKGIMSCNSDGTLVPTKITDIAKTRLNATFVRVHLDNGNYIDATPDHRFMLRDGTFIEAQYLDHGDSLMPYYDKVKQGRRFVLDNKEGLWWPQYRLVATYKYGILEKGHQVHHINEIKIDDDFDNLEYLTTAEHYQRHSDELHKSSNKTRRIMKEENPELYYERYGRGGRNAKGTPKCPHMRAALSAATKGRPSNNQYKSGKDNIIHKPGITEKITIAKFGEDHVHRFMPCRCFNCGKIFEIYSCDHDYNKYYLSKERLFFCDNEECQSIKRKPKIYKSIKLYEEFGIEGYEEARKLLKNSTVAFSLNKFLELEIDKKWDRYDPVIINHKVDHIEYLDVVEDAYDITVENESHTFATAAGVFIHNCDDPAGFSGGTSLTKLDSRYARTIKRIQNAYIGGITTLINLFALSKGLDDHVNNFTIKMLSPSTVEDQERDETLDNRMNIIGTFMDLVGGEDMTNPTTRKSMMTYFINNYLNEPELAEMLEEDNTAEKATQELNDNDEEDFEGDGFDGGNSNFSTDFGGDTFVDSGADVGDEFIQSDSTESDTNDTDTSEPEEVDFNSDETIDFGSYEAEF